MQLKDITSSQVFLSGRADKFCRQILSSTKQKRKDQSYAEVINRVVVDYSKENDEDKDKRLLRLYFLSLSLKDSMTWDKSVSTKVYFRRPAMEMIHDFQNFARKRNLFINKIETPNVIIHDYISIIELKGISFVEYYLSKHLIQSV